MSLSLALNNALSGLNVNQQSLAVLSQNIANANTPGYSRKIINQQSVYLDGVGAGVTIQEISRKVDEYLIKSIRLQSAAVGRTETASDYMDRIQLLIGNPGAGNSTDAYISNFFNSVQSLAQTPENSTLRVSMVNTAGSMARQMQQLAQGLQELRLQADQDMVTAIRVINKNLIDLKQLNLTINQDSLLGKPVTELLDRRDIALRDLAQYMDVNTYVTSNGSVNVFTAGGLPLLDESTYQLSYNGAGSLTAFTDDAPLSPVLLYRIDENGATTGQPVTLITAGASSQVTTGLTTGKLRALLDLRDRRLPDMLEQLDTLAAGMRDEFNRIHNSGSAFPGANSYTGTRSMLPQDYSEWTGSIRLALLGADGRAVNSPYGDEISGVRPLTIDLASLDIGLGAGVLTAQGIINEINEYFGIPQNRAMVGNLNNIRLASHSEELPGVPPSFSFDFDLENISGGDADFFVTGITVLDDTNTDITSVTTDVPKIALDATGTYATHGNNTVTIGTALPPGISDGDTIYLSTPPGGPYDGIPAGDLGGFFTVSNVTSGGFDIEVATIASGSSSFDVAAQEMTPRYAQTEAGQYGRTGAGGFIDVDLSLNSASTFYTIRADVAVEDEDGNISIAQVSYRVTNSQAGLLNNRYSAQSVTGDGDLIVPTAANQPLARAIMVDADGNELPRVNGQYVNTEPGFLKIIAGSSSQFIAIDSLDSAEQGQPDADPPVDGTGRSFSHFFELNNFFQALHGEDGDNITGAAAALEVEARLAANPNLVSLGSLALSPPSVGTGAPLYTYELSSGGNRIIQQLADLGNSLISFVAAGSLGPSSQTFAGYAGTIIGAASTAAVLAENDKANATALMDGFAQRSDSISGVNLDEELANTIIYQNAYTASARLITVTNQLYDVLLNTFQT